MPVDTLLYAAENAEEMLLLRQQALDNEADDEAVIDSEVRYVDLINELSVNEMMLDNIPLLWGKALAGDEPFDNKRPLQVLAHLICRSLQTDWHSQLFSKVNSGHFDIDTLNLVFYLPPNFLYPLLSTAVKSGDKLREWALGYCVRNNAVDLATQWQELISPNPQTKIEAQFLCQFAYADNPAALQALAGNSDYADEIRFYAVLGLLQLRQPEALDYFRESAWLVSELMGYGRWLTLVGEEHDLRVIEAEIDKQLSDYDNEKDIPEAVLSTVTKLTGALAKGGDVRTVKWIYNGLLSHHAARLRVLGFETMLMFFEENIRYEGRIWLTRCPIISDECGELPSFSIKDGRQFWSVIESHTHSPLLPTNKRCRYSQPLDQMQELYDSLDSVSYETGSAGLIRQRTTVVTGLHRGFDELAPYSVFIEQKYQLQEHLEQFKKEIEYHPGSYWMWVPQEHHQGRL